jgi:hypothetical protein
VEEKEEGGEVMEYPTIAILGYIVVCAGGILWMVLTPYKSDDDKRRGE